MTVSSHHETNLRLCSVKFIRNWFTKLSSAGAKWFSSHNYIYPVYRLSEIFITKLTRNHRTKWFIMLNILPFLKVLDMRALLYYAQLWKCQLVCSLPVFHSVSFCFEFQTDLLPATLATSRRTGSTCGISGHFYRSWCCSLLISCCE